MILATTKMTIKGNKATLDKDLYLYRNNKNITVKISIVDSQWVFAQDDSHNILKSINPSHFTMRWMTGNVVRLLFENQPIEDGVAIWNIADELIDEAIEVGDYDFQITLHDEDDCSSISLPPVLGQIHVCKHIFEEEDLNIVGLAQVGTAIVGGDEDELALTSDDDIWNELAPTSDDDTYKPTEWKTGDFITAERLNNIESGILTLSEGSIPFLSTSLNENVEVMTGADFDLGIDFYSPNIGDGTLEVFVNDIRVISTKVPQGESVTPVKASNFNKGTNKVVTYVLDRAGKMTNSLTFYIRYGGTEFTYEFNPYMAYEYQATIRYYFTPTALDTSQQLLFFMSIDGETQAPISCSSDIRAYYTFPNKLSADSHYCEAWVEDAEGTVSPVHKFNLIILAQNTIVVATDNKSVSIEEGSQLSLDYRVYMNNNTSFITKTYVNDKLVNTGTCGLDTNYYKTNTLTEGIHTIKLEVYDVTETYKDYVAWTVTVTPSEYTMLEPINAGALFIGTAENKTNSDERREYFVGKDQDGTEVLGTLSNFAFNSDSGWVNDGLIISGNSYAEIPIQPLTNNAKYGFTLDIEFTSKQIGVEDAEVLTLWNDEKNCGIRITTERLILRSTEGNECNLYFSDNERTNVIFIIDRNEKKAKIYLNGVMCEAFHLSDYEVDGVQYLEDFTVNSNIILGGKGKNGYSIINNLRVYEIALGTNEI